ncbi:MAG: MFS transporter [Actinomycetota bacterium]|nr:MFS transporter [Actinomycetota bacterium]
MREIFDLLRYERRARAFFVALAQSALGTGAGYIALLLIAYERFESPWAISLVLIADLIPAMLMGPVFGAAADRWSRKRCAIVADVLRVIAFGGIALVDSYAAMLAFALLAGTGTGLFTPSVLAALPSVVDDDRRQPAASSLYGVVADFGFTVGPMAAAVVLGIAGAETLMWANAVTFAMSGVLLASIRFGDAPAQRPEGPASLLAEARLGLRLTAGMRAIRVLLMGSTALLFGVGLFNVAELFFATEDLGISNAGFSLLVTSFGIGFIVGSLAGSKGGGQSLLKRRYLAGLLVLGSAFAATGLATSFAAAAATFALAGVGNGMVLVYERLLIQTSVADDLAGRVFGIRDAMSAWAFAIAFLMGGALLEAVGPSELILAAGCIGIVTFGVSAVALRREWPETEVDDAQVVAARIS